MSLVGVDHCSCGYELGFETFPETIRLRAITGPGWRPKHVWGKTGGCQPKPKHLPWLHLGVLCSQKKLRWLLPTKMLAKNKETIFFFGDGLFSGFMLVFQGFYSPRINMSPENRPKPKRKLVFQPSIFRQTISFREGIFMTLPKYLKTKVMVPNSGWPPCFWPTASWLQVSF